MTDVVAISAVEAKASTWAHRAYSELAACENYLELSNSGFCPHPRFVQELEAAADDERMHHGLCLTEAQRWGFSQELALIVTGCQQAPTITQPEDFAESIALHLCLEESFNAILLQYELSLAEQAPERILLRQLLKDEVRHARLGWDLLAALSRQQNLTYLAAPMAELLQQSYRELPERCARTLKLSTAEELFTQACQSLVQPGLEAAGIKVSLHFA